jgi:hypothetical protein
MSRRENDVFLFDRNDAEPTARVRQSMPAAIGRPSGIEAIVYRILWNMEFL